MTKLEVVIKILVFMYIVINYAFLLHYMVMVLLMQKAKCKNVFPPVYVFHNQL